MPFGRHRGEDLEDIPEQYLAWLLTLTNITPGLRAAVGQQLEVQERDDWMESAEKALPLIAFKWETLMANLIGDDPMEKATLAQGTIVLRELCAEVTGRPWPEETPEEMDMSRRD